ncbi:MAG TPA: S8 family serine peptidase, partial [Chthonomonadaceae bacterium]|nr:S8 family serine peptidase [Chthonomonadaceae bacterium]
MNRRSFVFTLSGLLALLGASTLVSAQANLPISRLGAQSAPPGRIPAGLTRLLLAPPRAHPQAPRPITRLLVKLKPGTDYRGFAQHFSAAALHNADLAPLAASAGSKPLLAYVRSHDAIHWCTYEVPSADLLQPAIAALRKDPDVLYAEPDYQVVPLNLSPPSNHYWGVLDWEHTYAVWGLGDTDEASAYSDDSTTWDYSWSPEQVSALQAWNVYPGHYQTASERVGLLSSSPASLPVVADIDTGVDLTHPNFSFTGNPSGGISDTDVSNGGELNVSFSRSFVGPTHDGYQGDDPTLAMDDYGHGTATTSLIVSAPGTAGHDAAWVASHSTDTWTYVGEQVYPSAIPGLGFPAQVVALKVADANGDGSDSDLLDAMLYATADWTDPNTGITHTSPHAVILNMSLTLNTTNYPQALQDAVDFCWNHGTLCVAAAGNDGAAAGGSGSNTPRYPARCDKVLAISATTYDYPQGGVPEQIASYSDYGDQIGVCAPGGDAQYYVNTAPNAIVDPIPELIMPFVLQPTYTVIMNDPNGTSPDSQYAVDGFAGPGLGEFPGTSFAAPQVTALAALYASANKITQSTPNGPQLIVDAIELGADNINGNANGGYDPTYGWGRINAAATIQNLNNRSATVGGCIGRVRYVDTVVGNVTVTATPAAGGPSTSTSTDPDGLYHIYDVSAAPGGTVYNVSATVYGATATQQVTIYPGCDQLGVNLTAGAAVAISKVSVSPATVPGSKNATGTVTLSAPAPTGGEI